MTYTHKGRIIADGDIVPYIGQLDGGELADLIAEHTARYMTDREKEPWYIDMVLTGDPLGSIAEEMVRGMEEEWRAYGLPVQRGTLFYRGGDVGTWTLHDDTVDTLTVTEEECDHDLPCFVVTMVRDGETREQVIHPLGLCAVGPIRSDLDLGESPIGWDDGLGRMVHWDNATPVGGEE